LPYADVYFLPFSFAYFFLSVVGVFGLLIVSKGKKPTALQNNFRDRSRLFPSYDWRDPEEKFTLAICAVALAIVIVNVWFE